MLKKILSESRFMHFPNFEKTQNTYKKANDHKFKHSNDLEATIFGKNLNVFGRYAIFISSRFS